MDTQIPPDSMLICPEIADPHWTNCSGQSLVRQYSSMIATCLILGRPLLFPPHLPDLLESDPSYYAHAPASQMIEMLTILEGEGDVVYLTSDGMPELASKIAYTDRQRAEQLGLAYSGSQSTYALIPVGQTPSDSPYVLTKDEFLHAPKCLLGGGHSGFHSSPVATANYICLMAQQHGCDFVEPISTGDFSLSNFTRLKQYIWATRPNKEASRPLSDAKAILKFYVPYIELVDAHYNVDLPLIRSILRIRQRHMAALNEWKVAIREMKKHAAGQSIGRLLNEPIPLSEVLQAEYAKLGKLMSIAGKLMTLLGTIFPLISFISDNYAPADLFQRMKEQKIEERMDFYFYVQSMADAVSTWNAARR